MNKHLLPNVFTILKTSHTGYEQLWIQHQEQGIRYSLPGCIPEDSKAKLTLICSQVEQKLATYTRAIPPNLANKKEKELRDKNPDYEKSQLSPKKEVRPKL